MGEGSANITPESMLFARLILLIILFALIWAVLSNISLFNKSKIVLFIISAAVGILSVRSFTVEMLATVLIPYTTFGFVVTASIPFLIFFFLVNVGLKSSPPSVRRVAWIFFAVIFLGLWITTGKEAGSYRHIYLVTVIASLIMMKLDGTIRRFFNQIKVEKTLRMFDDKEYFRRKEENKELNKDYITLITTGTVENIQKAEKIMKKIKANEKQMGDHEAGIPDRTH
jgi:hypothetical protein